MLNNERLNANRTRTLLPGENQVEFDLFSGYFENLANPANDFEALLTDDVVTSAWDLRRIDHVKRMTSIPMEAEAFAAIERAKRRLYSQNWRALQQVRGRTKGIKAPELPGDRRLM